MPKKPNLAADFEQVTPTRINAALLEVIRKGRYLPGAQLPNERKLAETFGASRQQVRDALLILNEMGLISRRVGSGTWLSENAPQIIERMDGGVDTQDTVLETIEARLIFEPAVAALAARHVSEVHVKAMKAALDDISKPASWLVFKSRTYQFARTYYLASGNGLFLRIFDQIIKARAEHSLDGRRDNVDVSDIVRNHNHEQLAQIFRAIADGDEIRAETAARNHLIAIAASSGLG